MKHFKPVKLPLQCIDQTQRVVLLGKTNPLTARYNNYFSPVFAEKRVCENEKNSK